MGAGPGTPAHVGGGGRWRTAGSTAALALGLAAATLLLYARVAGYGFVRFDDNRYVTDNLIVQRGLTWDGALWSFTTLHASNWHPLTWLSHMLDVELFGLDAGAHHLVNAALHAANAALLFLVLLRLTGARGRSLAVAALFAIHPAHVESVAWIAERKDVLSTLFGLLALLAWARYAERRRPGAYAAAAAAFAASLLAKPMWVTLPFLLLLLDVWPLRRVALPGSAGSPGDRPPVPLARAIAEKLPLLGIAAASSAVTIVAQYRGGAITGLDVGIPLRLGNAAVSYVRYVGMTLWPADLAVFYPYAPISAATGIAAALGVLAATALALLAVRERPWLAVGWCWFLGTLVPVIGLVQVGGQAFADRYTYLPMVGLLVAIVWGVHELAGRLGRGVATAAAIAAAAALSAVAWVQIGHWESNETLFRHALAVTRENALAHASLSDGLRVDGRLDEALAHAEEAVRIEPASSRHWNNLAVVLLDLKRPVEAREAVNRSLRLNAAYTFAWTTLGITEQDLGNLPAAEAALVRVTELAPRDPQAWFRLGLIRSQAARWPEAAAAYEEAVRIAPNHFGAWTNLAVYYQSTGRLPDAARAFLAAARADPASYVGWRNLGVFDAKIGRAADAAAAFRQAVRLRPRDPDLLVRLGTAQLATGARDDALSTAAQLEALAPALAAELRARVASP